MTVRPLSGYSSQLLEVKFGKQTTCRANTFLNHVFFGKYEKNFARIRKDRDFIE